MLRYEAYRSRQLICFLMLFKAPTFGSTSYKADEFVESILHGGTPNVRGNVTYQMAEYAAVIPPDSRAMAMLIALSSPHTNESSFE